MTKTKGKPKLFFYSLLLPALWVSLGVVTNLVAPEVRFGIFGLVLMLLAATATMSWLLARKYRRRFHNNERLRLTAYCFVWAILAESLVILYAMSFPEEVGFSVDTRVAIFSIAITAVVDFLLVWASLRYWSPRFIDWYLRSMASAA